MIKILKAIPMIVFYGVIIHIVLNWGFYTTSYALLRNSLAREYQYYQTNSTPICMSNDFKAANFNLTKDGSVLVPLMISKKGDGIQSLLEESGCPQATIGEIQKDYGNYDWYVKSVFCYKTNKEK